VTAHRGVTQELATHFNLPQRITGILMAGVNSRPAKAKNAKRYVRVFPHFKQRTGLIKE